MFVGVVGGFVGRVASLQQQQQCWSAQAFYEAILCLVHAVWWKHACAVEAYLVVPQELADLQCA